MTPIELTEKHKDKLLEMCKVLYPEYVNIDIEKDGILTLWKKLPPTREWDQIHWFEFCFTELSPTLALNTCKTDILMDVEYMNNVAEFNDSVILDKIHPVDYLYKEFKKLNDTTEKNT